MLSEVSCWHIDWNTIGTWVGAVGSLAAGAAAFWAWRTAQSAHELSKLLAERAEADAINLELERLSMESLSLEMQAFKLQSLGRSVVSRAKAKALASGNIQSSRLKGFCDRTEALCDEASRTLADWQYDQDHLDPDFPNSIDEVRVERIRLAGITAKLRNASERLEIESQGWI